MIGRTIGTYKIEQKIGEGGMGAVYRGVDQMLQRIVAVKVLRPELAQRPRVLERFRSEAMTLARLNHPNVATLYSFLQDEDEYFMILEFVQGQTFDDLLRQGAIPYEKAIPLFCQALDGIAHAHTHGVVHRDIKPANVMLTDAGIVKVMDFGIARVFGTARMTRTGHLIGTIEYMSPEQVRGQETDARSDIYSLGVLLYEMLTGRVPFEADSDFDLMQAHVKQTPRPLRVLRPSVPAALERAVLRALAKKPTARFPDTETFKATLEDGLRAALTTTGEQQEGGRGVAWLRGLFASAPSASTASDDDDETVPLAEAFPASSAETVTAVQPVKETRLVDPKETRLAPEAAASTGAATGTTPRPSSWTTMLRQMPPWQYAVAAAPVLLLVLAYILWEPAPIPDGPDTPAADTLAVVTADTAGVVPVTPAPVNPEPQPEQPATRDQLRLLSPEEFAQQNPEPQQPANVPETVPETPKPKPKPTTPSSEPERVAEELEAEETQRPGTVRVIIRPYGDVYLNGQRKASEISKPYIEEVKPGTYRVRAVHPRFGQWEKHISVQPGKTREVLFNFNRQYTLTVTSQPPNAEIIIDGKATGRYTPSVVKVRPGQHRIRVRRRGFSLNGGAKQLTVDKDRKAPVHFTLRRTG